MNWPNDFMSQNLGTDFPLPGNYDTNLIPRYLFDPLKMFQDLLCMHIFLLQKHGNLSIK